MPKLNLKVRLLQKPAFIPKTSLSENFLLSIIQSSCYIIFIVHLFAQKCFFQGIFYKRNINLRTWVTFISPDQHAVSRYNFFSHNPMHFINLHPENNR